VRKKALRKAFVRNNTTSDPIVETELSNVVLERFGVVGCCLMGG
jgi:hypothetical protein